MVMLCSKAGCRAARRSDIDLTWSDPSVFIKSQLPCYWFGVVWHSVWCIYFTTTLFIDVFYYTSPAWRVHWYIYFRHWVYISSVLTSGTEAVVRFIVFFRFKSLITGEATTMPWFLKVQWIIFNVHNVVSLISTVFHLSLIPLDMSHTSVNQLFLTSVYVIVSFILVSMVPVKICHFYQPTVFVTIYAIWSGIYQEIFNFYYNKVILDWSAASKSAIVLVFMVVVTPFCFQCILFVLYRIRSNVYNYCKDGKHMLPQAVDRIHRDITATDVVLEESSLHEYVDVNLNVKDDFDVKSNAQTNNEVVRRNSMRLYKSESDLRDYRAMNGFYCEFSKCNRILHHTHTAGDVFISRDVERIIDSPVSDGKGSQVIVVKGCVNNESDDGLDDTCDRYSDDSFTSSQITAASKTSQ